MPINGHLPFVVLRERHRASPYKPAEVMAMHTPATTAKKSPFAIASVVSGATLSPVPPSRFSSKEPKTPVPLTWSFRPTAKRAESTPVLIAHPMNMSGLLLRGVIREHAFRMPCGVTVKAEVEARRHSSPRT